MDITNEIEQLLQRADQEKEKGNRKLAIELYVQAFEMLGWSTKVFEQLIDEQGLADDGQS